MKIKRGRSVGRQRKCPKKMPEQQQRVPVTPVEPLEQENETLDDFMRNDSREEPVVDNKARRMAIAYVFVCKYNAKAESEHFPWVGKQGLIACIRKDLNLNVNSIIRYILEDVLSCKNQGLQYTGLRNITSCGGIGRPPLIQLDSMEAELIVDGIEEGQSICNCCYVVNEHRRQEGLTALTLSVI
jgi:hypothetical protein